MRKRFKVSRICSSENYTLSRKYHIKLLEKGHKTTILQQEVTYKGIPYVSCFGKLIQITAEEAEALTGISNIVWLV